MAETTPTVKKTKIPTWGYLAIGVVVVGGVYLYKKKKEKEEEEGGKNPYTAQSFIPVTAENVAGAGSPQVGTAPGAESELNLLLPFIESEKKERNEIEKGNKEFTQALIENIQKNASAQTPQVTVVTGGGAPASGPAGGGPPSGGTPMSPVKAPTCPADFPNYNPARGCWRWSRTTHEGCKCHGYQSGALECEHRSHGQCVW